MRNAIWVAQTKYLKWLGVFQEISYKVCSVQLLLLSFFLEIIFGWDFWMSTDRYKSNNIVGQYTHLFVSLTGILCESSVLATFWREKNPFARCLVRLVLICDINLDENRCAIYFFLIYFFRDHMHIKANFTHTHTL